VRESVSPLAWVAVICFSGVFVQAQQVSVQSWITTTDEHGTVVGLEEQPNLVFGSNAEDSVPAIHVDEKVTYQRMEGGGAAFTDGAAWLINEKLSPVQRDEVMKRLFDPVDGIGVSFLRNPIGSSDLTRGWYTLDDDETDRNDPSLPHFSIDHDLADIIPLTLTARKLNPKLTLMINAWSPPAWMKSSGSLVAGDVLPQYYVHHANYFVKAIQAYEAHGLHVNYISLNNEPTCCKSVNYPSLLTVTPAEMATMLKDYWFPAFEKNHLTTKILLLDFNWGNANLVLPLLADPTIRSSPFVGGVAWHGYSGSPDIQSQLHDRYGTEMYFTERSGFGEGSKQQKQDMRDMVHVFRNWGKTFVKWPVATDENLGPYRGGCAVCTGLVMVHTEDKEAGAVEYTTEYYTMGQFTKFVTNGALRIESDDNPKVLNVAFQNPDGSLVLIAFNDTTETQRFKIIWHAQALYYALPTNTSVTFEWRGDGR
jgi:glucosylceramidase